MKLCKQRHDPNNLSENNNHTVVFNLRLVARDNLLPSRGPRHKVSSNIDAVTCGGFLTVQVRTPIRVFETNDEKIRARTEMKTM